MREEIRNTFRDMCSELFEENPDLVSFGWNQYSPYFNDGDACIFSVNLYDLEINSHGRYSDYDDEEDQQRLSEERENELRDHIISILEQVLEHDFEAMFGNHVSVTVTADGVEIDECDHD